MIKLRTTLGIFLMVLNFSLYASWNINTTGKKGIYIANSDKHQLSIVENKGSVDFFLSLHAANTSLNPENAVMRIGDLREKTGPLQLIDQYAGQLTYLLKLRRKQKTTLLNNMISGLVIDIKVNDKNNDIPQVSFSLSGFTARLNDFLIAKEIDNLDYEWLLENHKDRELLCYYAANIYVKAMLDRLDNGNYRKTIETIPKTGIEKLDSVTGELVENAYSIPARKLPTDPRGDKYGIFRACMAKAH